MSEMGDSRRVVRSSLPPDFRFASKAAVERRAAPRTPWDEVKVLQRPLTDDALKIDDEPIKAAVLTRTAPPSHRLGRDTALNGETPTGGDGRFHCTNGLRTGLQAHGRSASRQGRTQVGGNSRG